MTPQTLATVRRLAVETLRVPEGALTTTTTLADAGVDSLGALELVFAVEGHYGISIDATEVARIRSLGDLAASVDRLTDHEVSRYAE
jgi:acyl carrier protein